MKKKNIILFIAALALILLLALSYTNSQRGMNKVTGHATQVGASESSGTDPSGDDDIPVNESAPKKYDTFTPADDGGDDGNDYYVPPTEPEDEEEETGSGAECTTDEDCKDDNPCTPEVCHFAGHPNAYCAEPITEKIPHDGCCPPGAWVDTDIDCPPVCGNHKCELGEGYASCEEDCPNVGHSDSPAQDDGGQEPKET
ncbi:hypothetical protein KY359_02860 [Candidatus Woesearchaeota archaeon]|nr:hypothetical protein [Candidatus Woesearchaeota archaeon]